MQVRQVIKKILPRKVFELVRDAVYPEKISILEERLSSLFNTYYQDVASTFLSQKTAFKNAEFKVYSKHGCDGMLLYIFSKVGTTNHTFVEIGIEDGRECNTGNLSINFGWKGLLIDANKEWVESARKYYSKKLESMAHNVKVAECFVTAESINPLLIENKVEGEIDLLSIDIDSNDYWVWKSITAVNPRVVVIEYNPAFGDLRSMTIKYDPNFYKQKDSINHRLYSGASLTALTKLGKEKGYTFVACDSHGHDAYFVRNDAAEGKFVELSAKEAFYPNLHALESIGDTETQFEQIKHLAFDEI